MSSDTKGPGLDIWCQPLQSEMHNREQMGSAQIIGRISL